MWIKPPMFVCLGVLIAGTIAFSCHEEKPVEAESHLNVIFIMADDLGYGDIEPYGQTIIHTPQLNRLRNRGMRFTQCYAGTSVSAPSRCAFMTGLHTGHTFLRGNKRAFPDRIASKSGSTLEGQVAMPKGTFSLAKMFKEKGYSLGCFGKWGLGYPGSDSDPMQLGFDRFFGYNCQLQAQKYYPDHLWDGVMKVDFPENTQGGEGIYSADIIHKVALDYIRSVAHKPFFIDLTYTLPHAELVVPHDSTYYTYCQEIPMSDETPFVVDNPDVHCQYSNCDRPLASYATMVSRLDRYVGEVLDLVDSLGIADKTLIVFTSDNGPSTEGGGHPEYFHSGGELRGLKEDLYEGGIRVPMIISCPGLVAEGVDNDHIMAFWDIMPTFAQLIGYDQKFKTDGMSFAPTLMGQGTQMDHDYLYWEFHKTSGMQAVREGKWKGLRFYRKGLSPIFELYDLESDLSECHNVASRYPDIVGHLQQLMDYCHTDSDLFNFGR